MFLGALMKGSTMAESKRTWKEGTITGVDDAFSVSCGFSLVWVSGSSFGLDFGCSPLIVVLSLALGSVLVGSSSFGVFGVLSSGDCLSELS